MDTAYVSAIAALSGSVIGGLTSLAASWITQNAQARTQQLVQDKSRREELYKTFIEEASRLYGNALIWASFGGRWRSACWPWRPMRPLLHTRVLQ